MKLPPCLKRLITTNAILSHVAIKSFTLKRFFHIDEKRGFKVTCPSTCAPRYIAPISLQFLMELPRPLLHPCGRAHSILSHKFQNMSRHVFLDLPKLPLTSLLTLWQYWIREYYFVIHSLDIKLSNIDRASKLCNNKLFLILNFLK